MAGVEYTGGYYTDQSSGGLQWQTDGSLVFTAGSAPQPVQQWLGAQPQITPNPPFEVEVTAENRGKFDKRKFARALRFLPMWRRMLEIYKCRNLLHA